MNDLWIKVFDFVIAELFKKESITKQIVLEKGVNCGMDAASRHLNHGW